VASCSLVAFGVPLVASPAGDRQSYQSPRARRLALSPLCLSFSSRAAGQIILAVIETGAYLASTYHTTVFMDENLGGQLRINFNITMHDLSCDFATVDLVRTFRATVDIRATVGLV
jgi:hypothetical protein